jgi:hypothetical protein
MLLFSSRFHAGLVSGDITLTFRQWEPARVRPGRRYRCHPIGVLEVDAVDQVTIGSITDDEARRAGLSGRTELLAYLGERAAEPLAPDMPVFRIGLHHAGDGDRVPEALDTELTEEAVREIERRLARFDGSSRSGPWTDRTLALIEAHPRTAASRLARMVGRETPPFKADVVKLKKLGLTQSFEVGYEISPRGRAFLERRRRG